MRLLKGMHSVTVIVTGNGIRGLKVKSWMRLLKGMLSVTVSVTIIGYGIRGAQGQILDEAVERHA